MREIALDTETTGLDPASGHRVVEIGCVEMINHIATGRTFHAYLNPDRPMPAEAQAIHGLSDDFLADKPRFEEVAADFLDFIGDAPLVIHNAEFDMKFLNAELGRLGFPPMPMARAVDTVQMARRRFPGAPANLDALCRRFGIDNAERTLHGALLDAGLLAEVYLELRGGRQPDLVLGTAGEGAKVDTTQRTETPRTLRPARPHGASPEEEEAHRAFIEKLAEPIWLN